MIIEYVFSEVLTASEHEGNIQYFFLKICEINKKISEVIFKKKFSPVLHQEPLKKTQSDTSFFMMGITL